jgi:hypothetical protein
MTLSIVGDLHSQIGPVFRALVLSSCPETSSIKGQLESAFEEYPFDTAAVKIERPKKCLVLGSNIGSETTGASSLSALLDLPKTDLAASLPSDCIEKMVRCVFLYLLRVSSPI